MLEQNKRFFDKGLLFQIQDAVVSVGKCSVSFKKELKDRPGFVCYYNHPSGEINDPDSNFTESESRHCMELMPESLLGVKPSDLGVWWSVTGNIEYDMDVISGITSGYFDLSEKDSNIVKGIYVESDINYPNYYDFAPSLLNTVHKWSRPANSKGIGEALNLALSRGESGFAESVTHIYMDGKDMVWQIYGVGLESSKSVAGGNSYINNLETHAETLMKYLNMLGKPIKEIFVIKDSNDSMKGKFIRRKCPDGEFVLTVY